MYLSVLCISWYTVFICWWCHWFSIILHKFI